MQGLEINLHDNISHLIVDGRRPTAQHSPLDVSWKSSTQHVSWSEWVNNITAHGGMSSSSSYGTCNIDFSYHGTGQWQGSSDPTNHPNQLGLIFAFDQMLKSKVTADDPSF